jgi:hypothetical protein
MKEILLTNIPPETRQKVVIATTISGFRLSNSAVANIARLKRLSPIESLGDDRLIGWGNPDDPGSEVMFWDMDRSDPALIETLENLGPEVGLPGVILKVVLAEKGKWVLASLTLPDGGEVETLKRIDLKPLEPLA